MGGQRVLVTAGASGIGREIAFAFSAAGAAVFVCDLDEAALQALARQHPTIRTGRCDVSRRADVERVVAETADALGGLDVLVNNAGIGGPTAPVQDTDPDAWEQVLAVNLTGTFDVTRLAIPHLKRSGGGAIINMASLAGRYGYPNRSAYCVSKWGIVGFTKTLAIELGPDGIRVNAIAPGAVDGPRIRQVFEGRARVSGRTLDEVEAEMLAIQSVKRLVDPKEVAALAVFLASDAARSISGQVIPIDNDAQKAS